MAEAIVSIVCDQLKTTIIDKAQEEVNLIAGIGEEAKKLQVTLNHIRRVLADAEEKKTRNEAVKLWLDELKDASYDMEDALDLWRTELELEALHGPKKGASDCLLWKVLCDLFPCFSFHELNTRHAIALNIKEISQRLDKIAKDKEILKFTMEKEVKLPNRRETAAFTDVSGICGRDEEKSQILSYLFGGNGEPIQTISIVGSGGLGKTALAQKVSNDHSVIQHFNSCVIWVCVSDYFDVKKVAKDIIVGLDKNISGLEATGLESVPFNFLLQKISDSVRGKKFLLVLDDVWEGIRGKNWESLKHSLRHGAEGSRILVTTRSVEVAEMMGCSSQSILLGEVDDEVSWQIIQQIALDSGRSNAVNLEEIGRNIARKCKGLPLAAVALGYMLKSKKTRREWGNVLNSDMWGLNSVQNDIFVPLFLSYHDLDPAVKQCFEYCLIYPKDHLIWVRDLIDRWMAQGYLGFGNDADLETKGQEYFNILANRSFFQDIRRREGGTMLTCRMHDMIHDFAQYLVMSNEFVTKEIRRGDFNIQLNGSRHFTLLLPEVMSFSSAFDGGMSFPSTISGGMSSPPAISGAEKLRSLVIFSRGWSDNSILDQVLPGLLNQSSCLRLLDFRCTYNCLGKQVPAEIGKLMLLRQLDLSYTGIESLPVTLSNLLNLLNLDLMRCKNLKELPAWIAKLINLRFLRTSGCKALTHYPKHIRRLTSLRRLLGAIVRADCNDAEEFSIADLGHLQHLDTVWLKVKGDTIDMNEASKPALQHLYELRIYLVGKITRDEIVEALDPPSDVNLQFFDNYLYL